MVPTKKRKRDQGGTFTKDEQGESKFQLFEVPDVGYEVKVPRSTYDLVLKKKDQNDFEVWKVFVLSLYRHQTLAQAKRAIVDCWPRNPTGLLLKEKPDEDFRRALETAAEEFEKINPTKSYLRVYNVDELAKFNYAKTRKDKVTGGKMVVSAIEESRTTMLTRVHGATKSRNKVSSSFYGLCLG